MINRQVVRCLACDARTLVRIQVGWQEKFPLRFGCGRCGILLSGEVACDFSKPLGPDVRYENAELVVDSDGEFHVEASSDFLMRKVCKANGQPMEGNFSPFMRSFARMNPDRYGEFERRAKQFAILIQNEWPRVRRISELWLGRKVALIKHQIASVIPSAKLPVESEAQACMANHHLNAIFFEDVREPADLERVGIQLGSVLKDATPPMRLGLTKLAAYFVDSGKLADLERRTFELMCAFVTRFRNLVPAFGLRFLDRERVEFEEEGITTATFEELKPFYIDAFELAADAQTLLVAWNNALTRGDFTSMATKRRDVTTLESFCKKKKGERVEFLALNEPLDWMLRGLDHQLRNGVTHGSCRFDQLTQQITYKPKEDGPETRTLYLVEFAERCLRIFETVLLTADVVFVTRRIAYATLKNADSGAPNAPA